MASYSLCLHIQENGPGQVYRELYGYKKCLAIYMVIKYTVFLVQYCNKQSFLKTETFFLRYNLLLIHIHIKRWQIQNDKIHLAHFCMDNVNLFKWAYDNYIS